MRAVKFRGFTLVELLVVIAIIGMLVALLLPAIQAAREAARRNQCVNNLKQIGVALQMHHDAKKILPPGRNETEVGPGTASKPLGVSWAFALLPYLEQDAIHRSLVNTARVDDLVNSNAMRSPVDVYYCPSRRNLAADRDFDNNDQVAPEASKGVAAGGDYEGNAGIDRDYRKDPDESYERALQEGVLYTFSRVSLRTVSDGTTLTFAVGEKYVPTEDEARLDDEFEEAKLHYYQGDTAFFAGDYLETIIAGAECGLAPRAPIVGDCEADELREQFGSEHPQICNFVFLDGHVAGIQQSVDLTAFHRLSTIADGQVVDASNL